MDGPAGRGVGTGEASERVEGHIAGVGGGFWSATSGVGELAWRGKYELLQWEEAWGRGRRRRESRAILLGSEEVFGRRRVELESSDLAREVFFFQLLAGFFLPVVIKIFIKL